MNSKTYCLLSDLSTMADDTNGGAVNQTFITNRSRTQPEKATSMKNSLHPARCNVALTNGCCLTKSSPDVMMNLTSFLGTTT
jgi:hypothetical protein